MSASAGRVLLLFKGTYSSSTQYQPMDVVYYNGSSYVSQKTSTGRTPTDYPSYWQLLAGGADLVQNGALAYVESTLQ